MRRWLASLLAVLGMSGLASAQYCATLPIPKAPDMYNTRGYYYFDCYGRLCGPVHFVRPPFEPFQGMLPAPQGNNGGHGGQGGQGGYPGLWFHPNVRSPRDFFMMGDDPAASPYRYGGGATPDR